ncbi:MAG: ABC transporter ATP-binding protein [Actinomycetales bacterium]|nr:ABC transporter ATP-binding protein [Actinomycetales bacterium]
MAASDPAAPAATPTNPAADAATPTNPAAHAASPTNPAADAAAPTVIVANLHIVYRVRGADAAPRGGVLGRLLPTGRATREVHALRGVSLTAHRGEAVGLIGRNGSGKSTLMRAIAGLLPASGGGVWTSHQASLLGVNAALMPGLTGARNIELGGLAMGLTRAEIAQRAPEISEFAGIGEFISLPMSAYSSGMSARLRFAIAAAVDHDILLIDEALATGDAQFQRRSEERIAELRQQAGTVFLVSHALGSIRATCERTIWLHEGLIRMDGPTDEVIGAYDAWAMDRGIGRTRQLRARAATEERARAQLARERAEGLTAAPFHSYDD